MTTEERIAKLAEIEPLLKAAQEAQTAYWDAIRELALAADVEFDGEDLEGYDAEGVLDGMREAS